MKVPKKWWIFNGPTIMRCDKPGCGYIVENVPVEEVVTYLDKTCPKCGSPLLTEADWKMMLLLNKVVGNPIIRALNWIGAKLGKKPRRYRVKMNGTGNATIEEVCTN
jgi:RNA polymerase subunit RPABC4/transcription elongation factor Spt4